MNAVPSDRRVDDSDPAPNELRCPKCRSRMDHLGVGEVIVDRCQSCAGLWLDALEKEKLLLHRKDVRAADAGAAIPPPHPAPAVMLCPRDSSRMIRMVDADQPHVGFESCTVCGGVFLDAGELTDLSEVTLREWVRRVVRM